MSKILMIVGSDRKHSFNAQLAREIVKEVGDRAETEFLDFSISRSSTRMKNSRHLKASKKPARLSRRLTAYGLLPLSIMPRILAVSKTFLTGFPVEPKRA